MAKTFDPKYVLRQTSNHLLRDLFEAHNLDLELDTPWDDLRETDVTAIFEAWQALPEAACRAIEIVLREVADMAIGDGGIRAIVEEANRQGATELLEELDEYESRHDKALWTYIRARDVWELAVLFARADSLSRGRYWIKRCDIPAMEPNTEDDAIEELASAMSGFFREKQSRGRYCQIEHYTRSCGSHYFFAYLDDYADTYVTLGTEGGFDRRPERRAFEIVFVYDPGHGTLEMYARGGKKVYVPLQELFCRIILGTEIGPEDRDSHPYELNGLIHRGFEFPTDPNDGITSVRVRKLRLSVIGQPRRRMTLEGDPNAGLDDVYDMVDNYLNQQRSPASLYNVTQVGLQFTFDESNGNLPRSMSFEVSHPNSSNLKSKPEAARLLAEKYLREWGIDRATATSDAQQAT